MADKQISLEQLKKNVQNFCEERNWDQFHNPKELTIALVTETAELLELFRFKSPLEVNKLLDEDESREKIGEELGDIFYLLLRFSQKYHFDLSTEFEKKMKLNEIKYPKSLAKNKNYKYTAYKNDL